jgi:lipopolysaccharide biosynthesis glycosyltransferase
MENQVHVFFACDDNFVKFTYVTLTSIMENASKDYFYNFYILNTDIKDNMKEASKNVIKKYPNCKVEFVDVTSYITEMADRLPVRDYYSNATYYRLFIAEMYPNLDKAIYIDSDTIVKGDISKLYNVDLENNLVAACHEQAMVQNDVFGNYVNINLGLDRYNYFNAGVLVINCKLFRDECVLDQFSDIITLYECKVTQDEDYLNIICKDRIKWVSDSWNTEIYGNIKFKDEEINLIHYIMWHKPWHFTGVKFEEYFWKYAMMTEFYSDIKDILDNYTDEKRKKDISSSDALVDLAKSEINADIKYVDVKRHRKPIDRLQVLKKIRQYENEARFSEDVEQDPPTRAIKPGEVDYTKKKIKSKIKTRFAYFIARRFLNKINRKKIMIVKDIVGKENLANLKTGAILTCNHFNALDSFAIQMAYEASCDTKKKKFYRVIREGNYTSFPGFYGFLMRNCYTLPLASNNQALKEFMKSTNEILQRGDLVLVYPEQSMWWNYKKPKPLKKGAFQFAANNNVPVVPCFITMRDSDIMGTDGFKIQEYTIHILEPIYPDPLKSKTENVKEMMDKNYQLWKDLYEKTYEKPLVYGSVR